MEVEELSEPTSHGSSLTRDQLDYPVCSYDPDDKEELLLHIVIAHEVRP